MAASDYKLCEMCDCKVFYDADVNYESYKDRIGSHKALCADCNISYALVVRERNAN